MQANHLYVLRKSAAFREHGRVLDYGCGGGEVVEEGLRRGLDIVGVECFYAGGRSQEIAASKGLLGTKIFELEDGLRIPFDDKHFNFVVSNQVFEHVVELQATLREIRRVLRPGGVLLALFPTMEVFREGHCGIPMIHWFSKTSGLRYPYMRLMRAMGFGHFTKGKSHADWARDFLDWLDRFTYYRSGVEVQHALHSVGFAVDYIEEDYIAFRLDAKRLRVASNVVREFPKMNRVLRSFCRRWGGRVILATRL